MLAEMYRFRWWDLLFGFLRETVAEYNRDFSHCPGGIPIDTQKATKRLSEYFQEKISRISPKPDIREMLHQHYQSFEIFSLHPPDRIKRVLRFWSSGLQEGYFGKGESRFNGLKEETLIDLFVLVSIGAVNYFFDIDIDSSVPLIPYCYDLVILETAHELGEIDEPTYRQLDSTIRESLQEKRTQLLFPANQIWN